MRIVRDLATLDPGRRWWVPATTAPVRDWSAASGCRRGARFLVDAETFAPVASGFPAFETRADCLRWIMANRLSFGRALPGAQVVAAALDEWMLGVDAAR